MKNFIFNTSDLELDSATLIYDAHNCEIFTASTLSEPKNNSVLFCMKMNDEIHTKLQCIENSIIIMNLKDKKYQFRNNYLIYSSRPRKAYAQILTQILSKCARNSRVKKIKKDDYYIHSDTHIGQNTVIEPFVIIGENVVIGKNCLIKSGTKIGNNVVIGDECVLKENSVVGSDGFGFERDEDGTSYRIPHMGGVIIGNHVELGAASVIAQGTILPTQISDYVKIDDHVFIAHNAKIGKGSFIIANSEISGSVVIGERAWIAPNACIRDGVTIGDNVIVGMGSVVIRDIESNCVVMGNPARIK